MPDLSVIIPAYNEHENVQDVKEAFNAFVKEIDYSIELIFVDDGSKDSTFNELINSEFYCKTKVLKLSRNFGSHAAIRAGIKNADSDNCMVYYMDMSEPISCISDFYYKLKEGYDVVYSERVGYKASLGSRIFAWLVIKYIEETYPKDGVSCIAFSKKIKDELNNNIENNSSIFFQIFQLGFKKTGIPVNQQERVHGKSKWTLSKKIKLFIDSFVMFSYMPIRSISMLGVIMSAIGIIWAFVIVALKIFGAVDFYVGWPTISCILLLGFGITNISLGIISEYLVRTLDASRNRPVYIVDGVYDLEEINDAG